MELGVRGQEIGYVNGYVNVNEETPGMARIGRMGRGRGRGGGKSVSRLRAGCQDQEVLPLRRGRGVSREVAGCPARSRICVNLNWGHHIL